MSWKCTYGEEARDVLGWVSMYVMGTVVTMDDAVNKDSSAYTSLMSGRLFVQIRDITKVSLVLNSWWYVEGAHSNQVTSSTRPDTLICHTTMHGNSINFLYNPHHVTLWCLKVVPVANAKEGSTQEHNWARVVEGAMNAALILCSKSVQEITEDKCPIIIQPDYFNFIWVPIHRGKLSDFVLFVNWNIVFIDDNFQEIYTLWCFNNCVCQSEFRVVMRTETCQDWPPRSAF